MLIMKEDAGYAINAIYDILESYFGDLKWWPAKSAFEMMTGAVLTQNTSWLNVEKAIAALKRERMLDHKRIYDAKESYLAGIIRSAGYHTVKAARLKELSRFFKIECRGSIRTFSSLDTGVLRKKLLTINGVGPETADSILLYAFKRPVFVADAYAKRLFFRHGIVRENVSYEELQNLVHGLFNRDVRAFNQYHAAIVETGKRFCRKRHPLCGACPLKVFPHM